MNLTFMDLRRYAIDNRIEIKLSEQSSDRAVFINIRGQARIPGDDKDFDVDEVVGAADVFELAGEKKPRRLSREEMATVVSTHFKARGFAGAARDEDD